MSDGNSLWRRVNDKYYILNGLYISAVFIIHSRDYFADEVLDFSWESLIYKMKSSGSILMTMLAICLLKYLRSCSTEQFLRSYFVLVKFAIFGRAIYLDPISAVIHFAIITILYLFTRQPPYLGFSTAITPLKSLDQFDQAVTKFAKKSSKRDPSVLTFKRTHMQFVEFYRDNEQLSNDTRALWAGFAKKYSTKYFKFYSGNLDSLRVEKFYCLLFYFQVNEKKVKGIAEQFDINVNQDSAEFPTVLLFEEGELKLRFPVEDADTYLGKQLKAFKSKAFEKYFRFHNRWFDTKDDEDTTQDIINEQQFGKTEENKKSM